MSAPIILVPGFWLGAWAWDDVVSLLRTESHEVTALTLPGLESPASDRSRITMDDHVRAIAAAVEAAGRPVVLAVHSGAGFPGYAATDRVPDHIAQMVYVDTAPGIGAMNPNLEGDEYPMPPLEELTKNESVDGLSQEQLETFARRAVPQPAAALREASTLTNDARLDVSSTVICTSATAEQMRAWAAEGYDWLAGLNELRNVTYIDLPTSHWPMWSRPAELAGILGDIASKAG